MKSVLIATIGTRDLMFQISSGAWFNAGDDRIQNGEIIGEQVEVISDLGLSNTNYRNLTHYLLNDIDTYIERIQPPIIGKIFYDSSPEIDKVYLVATDQPETVFHREKDTIYAAQIIKKWIIHNFSHFHDDNVTVIPLGNDGTNPSDFEEMFNWWRQTWRTKISVASNQSVWVCLKGGVGQTSESARISGISFYGDRIYFFEFKQNTKANSLGKPSDYSGPFLGTNYLWDRTQQQALKLLASYDYAETYDLLEPYFQQFPGQFRVIPNLLKSGIAWNQGNFDTFLNLAKSCTKIPKVEGKLWMAYEQAYLGVVRLHQKNTTEAMLHSYRAVEGLLYLWAIESFPKDVVKRENGYPLIKDSILTKYPSLRRHFSNSPVNLQGWLLEDLLNLAIPETTHSIDFKIFWDSAKDARNNFSHRLGGLPEQEIFKAWSKDIKNPDIKNSEQWQKRILTCINLVTGKSFNTLSKASLFAQIHTEVVEILKNQEIKIS